MDITMLAAVALGLLVIYFGVQMLWGFRNNPVTLKQKIEEGALVLDVRTMAEFGDGHHPAAINIPVDVLGARISELATDKDRCIIVYCVGGPRSARAAKMLTKAGYKNVINAGGLFNMPQV